jgi:hypothetical protein
MQDKPTAKTSMKDLLNEHRKKDGNIKNQQIDLASNSIKDELMTQEQLQAVFKYNESVTELDTLYTSVRPLNKVLVRVFLLEPSKTENGLLIPHKQVLPVPTNSGVGSLMEMESPYPYSNKAVIVSAPQMVSVKPGNIVQLESAPVRISGVGHNASIVVPYGYMHPDANSVIISTDPANRHYGYLLVPSHEIMVVLNA